MHRKDLPTKNSKYTFTFISVFSKDATFSSHSVFVQNLELFKNSFTSADANRNVLTVTE